MNISKEKLTDILNRNEEILRNKKNLLVTRISLKYDNTEILKEIRSIRLNIAALIIRIAGLDIEGVSEINYG